MRSQNQKPVRMTALIDSAMAKKTQTLRLVSSKMGAPGTAVKKFMPKNEVTKVAGRKAIVIHAMPRIILRAISMLKV